LANSVVKLYMEDYAKAWDALLQDLEVVPLRSVPQAAQDLYVLASPNSPMKELLTAVARQLMLSEPPKPTKEEAAAAAAVKDMEKAAQNKITNLTPSLGQRALEILRGGQSGNAPILPPGHEIDERYQPLRELVASTGGAPIDLVLKVLNDLQQ